MLLPQVFRVMFSNLSERVRVRGGDGVFRSRVSFRLALVVGIGLLVGACGGGGSCSLFFSETPTPSVAFESRVVENTPVVGSTGTPGLASAVTPTGESLLLTAIPDSVSTITPASTSTVSALVTAAVATGSVASTPSPAAVSAEVELSPTVTSTPPTFSPSPTAVVRPTVVNDDRLGRDMPEGSSSILSGVDSRLDPSFPDCESPGIEPALHGAMKIQMLELFNRARSDAGLPELDQVRSGASQCHAEDMRDLCFLSHWSSNGVKPHVRYARAGYDDRVAELVWGHNFCPRVDDAMGYADLDAYIKNAVSELLNDAVQGEGLLDPLGKTIEIGIAGKGGRVWLTVAIARDLVEFEYTPQIDDSEISMSGRVLNGVSLPRTDGFRVEIYFDDLPSSLTRGQLMRTTCVELGKRRGRLLRPLGGTSRYLSRGFSESGPGCPDPRDESSASPAPSSADEDRMLRAEVLERAEGILTTHTGDLIVASEWDVSGDEFHVVADVGGLVGRFGDGIYTAVIYGNMDDERIVVAEYPMVVNGSEDGASERGIAFLLPTPTNTPTPVATSTPVPSPPPTPTSTPRRGVGLSGLTEKEFRLAESVMLESINDVRQARGLRPVVLGNNVAAQLHAEDMRDNCFLSHWGSDGLQPEMRYTLTGGEQKSWENVSGSNYCPTDASRYRIDPIHVEVSEAMSGLIGSAGHLQNIVFPHHRKVNLGFAYRAPNLYVVQLFETDYIDFVETPSFDGGELSFRARLRNGALFDRDNYSDVQIYYDPLPHDLSRGQLHRTSCGINGKQIAELRAPPAPGFFYTADETRYTLSHNCTDPYGVSADAEPFSSYFVPRHVGPLTSESYDVPWITAGRWNVSGSEISISADLASLLDEYGDGVYTITVWGLVDGESTAISEYSIFVTGR